MKGAFLSVILSKVFGLSDMLASFIHSWRAQTNPSIFTRGLCQLLFHNCNTEGYRLLCHTHVQTLTLTQGYCRQHDLLVYLHSIEWLPYSAFTESQQFNCAKSANPEHLSKPHPHTSGRNSFRKNSPTAITSTSIPTFEGSKLQKSILYRKIMILLNSF